MKLAERNFKILDIDAEVCIEVVTRKDILSYIDEFIENLSYDWFNSDDVFMILYDDGTEDYISIQDYDGHKVKRQHIVSMVYSNDCTYCVYGNFEMNEYGVVIPSEEEILPEENIVEIK